LNQNIEEQMAARDRYSTKFACPECGKGGILHLSEDDYPFMKKLRRQVDKVEGDFSANMKNESDVSISCKSCGHKFVF
jgi:predicted RNA-binding Zn-ribbon protein involved in translation (DUF1610 family)